MPTYLELSQSIYEKINELRSSPQEFAELIEGNMRNFKRNNLYHREGFVPLKRLEGKESVQDLIKELSLLEPLSRLNLSKGLANAALHLAYMIGQDVSIEEASPSKILEEYGHWHGSILLLIDEGSVSGAEAVQSLLLDDGLTEKTNRKALLNPAMAMIGVGTVSKENSSALSVVLIATDFTDKPDLNEVVPVEDEIPTFQELDSWVDGALSLHCEITNQNFGDRSVKIVKQFWSLDDQSTIITEKVIK